MTDHQENWAALDPQQTLKAAGCLYKNLNDLIIFGVFPNGSVGTLFSSQSSPLNLMWILKAMDWDSVLESEDPMPMMEDTVKAMAKDMEDKTKLHPVAAQALENMQDAEHIIVAGLTDEQELTMATSENVNFMTTSFCVDWFRHQLLNQMSHAAQVAAQQAAQAAAAQQAAK